MRNIWLGIGLLLMLGFSSCQKDEFTHAEIMTDFGNIEVILYNSTPKHRDNFIKLANEGYYDDLLFHRVVNGFMIQGGDPDSKNAAPGQSLGRGGPGYQIDAEIGAPHFRGALAAARDGNPLKKSSGSQFYIVQGRPVTEEALTQMENQKSLKYSPEQRQVYVNDGGSPFLDGDYTVFGEVVSGMEVIDKIAELNTDSNNRPTEDVRMKVRILE
ncbi:peptidylprolyl isomerase [Flavilitoribacter nigricans]|uniref:Peptidyl-prolyl cis-trans isomerase n=1 Tax=Flavilitoribacter nigricans (strain ATCC 23147 / DSM 23189 / NBRC 102662 / NCIMB 1420 / SS-2) TaxID=1122177 RepID=A0A2D0N5I8_FLAN2|nr:peptidylprolyl isomerase [Flavilitoribacter nigricans]PHN03033.1 peptidylprolyl isomerase [Flavilitoribacter nigricans DSM 23189 = NBRC 102662]